MVITFPVSNRKKEMLLSLIKRHTKKGSLYYTDDHTAYTTLSLLDKHNSIAHKNGKYVREDTLTLMELKVSGVIQRCGCIIIGAYLKIIFISI